MLKVLKSNTNEAIELEELSSYVRNHVDLSCHESISSTKDMLKKLYNNRGFLANFVNEELKKGYKNFQSNNSYTPPSLILHRDEEFFIRANIWIPTLEVEEGNINVYGLLHDHNFDFLTLNYYGSGYTSKMYEYDRNQVEGLIGETIDLTNNGVLALKEGEMYLYRKGLDLHTQISPKDMSITINLMVNKLQYQLENQYILDSKSHQIQDIKGSFMSKKFIYDLALSLGDRNSFDILSNIHKSSKCKLTKKYLEKKVN